MRGLKNDSHEFVSVMNEKHIKSQKTEVILRFTQLHADTEHLQQDHDPQTNHTHQYFRADISVL